MSYEHSMEMVRQEARRHLTRNPIFREVNRCARALVVNPWRRALIDDNLEFANWQDGMEIGRGLLARYRHTRSRYHISQSDDLDLINARAVMLWARFARRRGWQQSAQKNVSSYS